MPARHDSGIHRTVSCPGGGVLEDHGYTYILLNLLVAHQAKQGTLRKVKTDAIDAYRLGNLFYKEDLEPARQHGRHLLDLRLLTRHHEAVTGLLIQAKQQFHALLATVFPEYRGVFSTLFAQVALRTLAVYPTADAVLAVPPSEVAATIHTACRSRSAA